MYEHIKQQFKEVIQCSQGIENPKLDILFNEWEVNKSKFIERFGGLIYEWPEPIEFSLDPKEKKNKAIQFTDIINDAYQNEELSRFLDANINSFFDNVVENNIERSDIPKGMKLIKAFKFFEKDKEVLANMQNLASRYIQENKIKGTLCFSVHPLDFLSSSENTYNWRSCHALDGEYRSGNLSYMTDNTTFMVYIKGADNEKLPNFPYSVPWNSKKWRMLIHSRPDDSMIFAGRQYPFSSKTGIDIVLNIYNNLMGKEIPQDHFWYAVPKFMPWSNSYVREYTDDGGVIRNLSSKYLVYGSRIIDLEEAVVEGDGALNYNDVLYSSCYKYPYYSILNNTCVSIRDLRENPLKIGRSCYCLHCEMDYIEDSGYMRCPDCELEYGESDDDCYTYCSCCDARVYYDDTYCVNDESVCDHCFNTECFVCDGCGEAYFNIHRHAVKVDEDDKVSTLYFCKECLEDYIDNKEGRE